MFEMQREKSLMFDTFDDLNFVQFPEDSNPQQTSSGNVPMKWMPSFDMFNQNETEPLTALLDGPVANEFLSESDSISSTNTREDLQLNAAADWIQNKKPRFSNENSFTSTSSPMFSRQHSLDLGDDFLAYQANPVPCQKPFDYTTYAPDIYSMHTTNLHSVHRVRAKKEHPSSNTATLKKRQGLTTSKFNGVCWNKRKMKWRARLSNKGTREFLGDFDTEEEAARAFDKRIKQLLPVKKYMDKVNFKEDAESEDSASKSLESKASCSSFVSI